MAFTGKLGTTDSRPGEIILGGSTPSAGGPEVYDRSLESTLVLSQEATCNIRNQDVESELTITDEASCPQIRHIGATSSLTFTITLGTSIKMLVATSSLALVQATTSTINDVGASSTLSLTSEASCNMRNLSATSTIAATVAALGESTRSPTSSALSLTSTATLTGVPLRKSASSALAVTQTAIGIGPIKRSVVDTLSITDVATSNVKMLTASDVLTLDVSSRVAEEFPESVTHTLSLTDTATGTNSRVFATSELSLTDTADTNQKQRSLTDSITLTSTATADTSKSVVSTLTLVQVATQGILTLQASDTISLTNEARNSNIRIVVPASTLELTDSARSSIQMLDASSSLDLQQELDVRKPIYVTATDELTTEEEVFDIDTQSMVTVITGLIDSAVVIVDAPRLASSIISFSSIATESLVKVDAIAADAESELTLTDEGRISKQHSAEPSSINLTQSATGVVGIGVESELDELDVEASFTISRANITASNTLEVTHAVSFIFERSNTLCTYTPFIGTSTDPNAPTPPSPTYPAPGATPGFRLQYPATGPVTDELLLRAPNMGNIDRLSMVRINRETRGGTLIVYADPIWPKVQAMLLSFSGLSYQQGQDLMEFMESHIGEEIRLIDYEDRLWRGVITNPQDPVVQDGKGCRYTASYEFEGEKV